MEAEISEAVFSEIAGRDPFDTLEAWYGDAVAHEPSDPNAMSLATVDADGLPNVRIVLMKGIDPPGMPNRGLLFYTNYQSAKGRELLASGRGAVAFYWKSLERQVRVRGVITPVTDREADEYFLSRPRESRIGAWASQQSRPLADRQTLEEAVRRTAETYDGREVPRPPHWSGFRLTPVEIEFWQSRPHRLHDRIVFSRSDEGSAWTTERLYP